MNASLVALLFLAACAAAAPNGAVEEKVGQLDPFPWFHPHFPPWLPHRTTTKKPIATTTEAATTTTEAPTTTTVQQTTTKHHKTTTKPHKTTSTTATPELPLYRGDYERLKNFGYYKIYNEHSSWQKAWKTCYDEDAHLLLLRSQEEYNALQAWKPYYEVPGYSWYGAHHRFQSQEFVTLFDGPLAESGYNTWSRDFTSNKTLYNNKDFPDMIVCLHPAASIAEGFLLVYERSSYFFVCKMDI